MFTNCINRCHVYVMSRYVSALMKCVNMRACMATMMINVFM